MKTISFTERAKWYYIETYSEEQNTFLEELIRRYNFPEVIQIPCSSGKNLKSLSLNSRKVIAFDNDKEMIRESEMEVKRNRIKNCIVSYGDLKNFEINTSTNLVVILNEAIQMFNPNNGELDSILKNIIKQLKGDLVLETFDYKNIDISSTRYFQFGQTNKFIKDIVFKTDKELVQRFHKITMDESKVLLNYYYKIVSLDSDVCSWCKSRVKLFHFDYNMFLNIISKYGAKVKKVYSDYNFSDSQYLAKKIIIIECA